MREFLFFFKKNGKIKVVWRFSVLAKAHQFTLGIYSLTKFFPNEEKFGLTSQMRRAAVSIPANIAEGYGRQSLQDYIRFLKISRGSLYELQTHLELSKRFSYINERYFQEYLERTNEIGRMLNSLIRKLETKKWSITIA